MGIWAIPNNTACKSVEDWNKYFLRYPPNSLGSSISLEKTEVDNLVYLAQRGIVPILLTGILYRNNMEFISGYKELYVLLTFLRDEIPVRIDNWPDTPLHRQNNKHIFFSDLNQSAQIRFMTAKIECMIISVDNHEEYYFLKHLLQ